MPNRRAIHGHILPPPRPTARAILYALLYLGLPIVGVLALLDLLLWWVFSELLGRCYGIFCLFG